MAITAQYNTLKRIFEKIGQKNLEEEKLIKKLKIENQELKAQIQHRLQHRDKINQARERFLNDERRPRYVYDKETRMPQLV